MPPGSAACPGRCLAGADRLPASGRCPSPRPLAAARMTRGVAAVRRSSEHQNQLGLRMPAPPETASRRHQPSPSCSRRRPGSRKNPCTLLRPGCWDPVPRPASSPATPPSGLGPAYSSGRGARCWYRQPARRWPGLWPDHQAGRSAPDTDSLERRTHRRSFSPPRSSPPGNSCYFPSSGWNTRPWCSSRNYSWRPSDHGDHCPFDW